MITKIPYKKMHAYSRDPSRCPICDGRDLKTWKGKERGNEYRRSRYCVTCDVSWVDVYTISEVEKITWHAEQKNEDS